MYFSAFVLDFHATGERGTGGTLPAPAGRQQKPTGKTEETETEADNTNGLWRNQSANA